MSTRETVDPAQMLDQIEARANAATPSPWRADTGIRGDAVVWGPDGQFLSNAQAEPHWLPNADGGERQVQFDVDRRDAEFIAHARTDVPTLVAALRAVLDLAHGCDNVARLNSDAVVRHLAQAIAADLRAAITDALGGAR